MGLKSLARVIAGLFAAALALAAYGYAEATRTPRVVTYDVTTPRWTAPPVRIALLSDTHAASPDMPPRRLARIAAQVNALKPDIIVLAGDYLSGRFIGRAYAPGRSVAPLASLRAPLGVYGVLGNHDFFDPGPPAATAAGLRAGGIIVLRNAAVRTRAGFWIAGVDDPAGGTSSIPQALRRIPPGAPHILLVHNPDLFAETPATVPLTLAGHTHGGQIAPWPIGPTLVPVTYRQWVRGVFARGPQRLVVTSGVGASGMPVRIGVPPEIVIVRLSGTGRTR